MKKMLAFATLLILFSCSKDQDANTALPASGTLLRYVKGASGNVQSEFVYDNTGKILTRNLFSGDKLIGQTHIRYKNGKAHLLDQKMDISSSTLATNYHYSQSEFIYHRNQIIQKNHFAKTNETAIPELRSFSVFEYNAGFLIKQTRFLEDGTPLGYTDYNYDVAGNIILSESYNRNNAGEMQLTQKVTYEHDQKNNPYLTVYLSVENIPFSINKNNIVRATATNYTQSAQGIANSSNTSYQEYNPQQLPLSVIEENDNRFLYEYN